MATGFSRHLLHLRGCRLLAVCWRSQPSWPSPGFVHRRSGGFLKTHFFLIDLENVQPSQLGLIQGDVRIKVFVGSKQTKIPLDLATAIQAFGSAAEYIKASGSGNNALDFHLAYYLGRWAFEFPNAVFHIISNDTGFDPLVVHLRSRKISCERSAKIKDLKDPLALKVPPSKSPSELLAGAKTFVAGLKAAKPAKMASLRNALKASLGGSLSETEVDAIVEKLQKANLVREEAGGKISYPTG